MEKEKRVERLRDRNIHVMSTEAEYEQIAARMKQTGHPTLSSYLIDVGRNGFVLNIDYSSLDSLCYEIHKIGVNINQIAHRVNTDDLSADAAIQEVNMKMDTIVQMVRKQFYKIP